MKTNNNKISHPLVLAIAALVLLENVAHAAPYYFYYSGAEAAPEQQQQQATSGVGEQVQSAAQQVQKVAGDAKDAVSQAAQGVKDQVQQQQAKGPDGNPEIPKRIQGHLSDLYSHGSSAVRGVMEKVSPDFKNIGHDITDAYKATRSEMGKRIEPIAQTVRPYIDQYVAPYVSQAREEVPKLISHAKPTLSKVGEQISGGISGVWSKIQGGKGGEGAAGAAQAAGQQAQAAGQQAQQTAEQVGQHLRNAISQQEVPEVGQAATVAAPK